MNKNTNQTIWQKVALVAAIFGIVISILLIANYFQLNRFDPVNTEIINALVDRLNENPNDESLREQIREVDLLARKAYFTNQWQVKMGGYMLLLSVAVIVLAYQILDLNKRKQVEANKDLSLDFFGIQQKARTGVIIVGTSFFLLAGLLTILTNHQLQNRFVKGIAPTTEVVVEEVVEQPVPAIIEEQNVELKEEEPVASAEVVEAKTNVEDAEEEKSIPEEAVKEQTKVEKATTSKSTKANFDSFKENFPSFRGFGGLGIVYQKNIPTQWDGASGENIAWKAKIPVHGYNSPIIWENKLFLTGANDNIKEVYCFDKNAGSLLWQKTIEGIKGSPSTVPKTTSDTGLAASTMATNGEKVFAIFATGDVVALSMTGELLWGINLGVPQNHYGHSSSLYTFKDKLLVQYDQKGGSKVLALDVNSGKTIWSTAREVKVSWASPILINQESKPELILLADPSVISYNPETGEELWKMDCIYGEVGPSAAYADGVVYALNEYASLSAIKLGETPEMLWEGDEYLSDVPSPVAANGLLIVSTSYGVIICHDALTGELYWEHDIGNNIYASPMLVGDLVYLLDTKGVMHIFKLSKTFEKVSSPALGEGSVCTPAFADGKIFIRAGNTLYAVGK